MAEPGSFLAYPLGAETLDSPGGERLQQFAAPQRRLPGF